LTGFGYKTGVKKKARLGNLINLGVLTFCLTSAFAAGAQEPEGSEAVAPAPVEKKKLLVGTKPAPPFAMKGEDGAWTGISIELWNDLAKDIGVEFEYKEFDLKGLLGAIESGAVDLGTAAITVTSEREGKFDFTHPFYFTGLGIAVQPPGDSNPIGAVLSSLLSAKFLGYLAGLVAVLLGIGMLIWLIERRANSEEFAPGIAGIWDGFWWSAVTMTTVGYGDTAPKTVMGRILGLIWMFAAIIIISFFTAGIASSLTVSSLESGISGPEDLPKFVVGTVENSSSERYLLRNKVKPKGFANVKEGLEAVAAKKIDAFVYDRPILQFHGAGDMLGKIKVLDSVFDPQSYGIGLPTNSELREKINTALLKRQTDEAYWNALIGKYLGN